MTDLRLLFSSQIPFHTTGYANQLNQLIKKIYNYNKEIKIGIICWQDWEIENHSIANINTIINNTRWGQYVTEEQRIIYKDVLFYLPKSISNYLKTICEFNTHFNADKIIIYQDIWPFEQFDINLYNRIKKSKFYLWLPIHTDFKNICESRNLLHLYQFDKISTFSKFGVEVLNLYNYKSKFINHVVDNNIFKKISKEEKEILRKRNSMDKYFICLMVSRNSSHDDRKAFKEQFEGFSIFAKDKKNVKLLIHNPVMHAYKNGLGGMIDLEKLVNDFKIENKIILTGKNTKTTQDIVNLYHLSDVLLFASKSEGFGIPAVEAQMCGIPVVTTDCTAMSENTFYGIKTEPEIISSTINGINSWSIPSPKNIAKALEVIYQNKLEYTEIPVENYLIDNVFNDWKEFLEIN